MWYHSSNIEILPHIFTINNLFLCYVKILFEKGDIYSINFRIDETAKNAYNLYKIEWSIN